jgi:hypothetical protein
VGYQTLSVDYFSSISQLYTSIGFKVIGQNEFNRSGSPAARRAPLVEENQKQNPHPENLGRTVLTTSPVEKIPTLKNRGLGTRTRVNVLPSGHVCRLWDCLNNGRTKVAIP